MNTFKIRDVVIAILNSNIYQNAHKDLQNYHCNKAQFLCDNFQLPNPSTIQEWKREKNPSSLTGRILSHLIRTYCAIPESYWGGVMCYNGSDEEMKIHAKFANQYGKQSSDLHNTIVDALTEVIVNMFPHTENMEFEFEDRPAPDPLDYW